MVVLPSRNETSSIAALEAFSYGRPVVGADVGGLGEILKESKGGLIFHSGDSNELADCMKLMIESSEIHQKLAVNAFKYAKKHTWERITEDYKNILSRSKL